MDRWLMKDTPLAWIFRLCLACAFLSSVACGNGGHIEFTPEYIAKTKKGAGFNMVPGSQALAIEQGQTFATGYSAKLQLSPIKGTTLSSPSGHTARLKYTVRNR
jgi:hypothetical protein